MDHPAVFLFTLKDQYNYGSTVQLRTKKLSHPMTYRERFKDSNSSSTQVTQVRHEQVQIQYKIQ